MSVFQVVLNQNGQGNLDFNPTTDPNAAGTSQIYGQVGTAFTTSKQREVYIMGPDKINRLLIDGATFTDCNYWKQYVLSPSGTANAATAFLTLLTDDGSVWSTIPGENVAPAVIALTVAGASGFAGANLTNIITTYGGYAVAAQIQNLSTSQDVKVQLNGSSNAIFTLEHNTTQVFAPGELTLSSIDFSNTASGAVSASVQVILSIQSTCNT